MIFASRFLRLEDPQMEGPDVIELQEELKKIGLYKGIADGCFGQITQLAVIQFQRNLGQTADGVVGPDTWNQLALRTVHQPVISGLAAYALPSIYIDTVKRRLKFSSPSLNKTYQVAVGKPSTPSPAGNWVIVQKVLNPGGPFGVRWMRLSVPWGGYGIHGTNNPGSIGKAVSHGCIRMYNDDVVEVYNRTPIGTPVTIVGSTPASRIMRKGNSGSDVAELQRMLSKLGYYPSKMDGYFGLLTEQAVRSFQTDKNLQVDGVAGPQTMYELQKAYTLAQNDQEP
jgi:peptidoglycan hydrolase-like protein with peptidoglycan-binding domain